MREIDFLPEWYPTMKRRRRLLLTQAWMTAAIVLALIGYAMLQHWRLQAAGTPFDVNKTQLCLTQRELANESEKLKYEHRLSQHDAILARLGIGVETTRLLRALEDAMTPDMSLTNISLEASDQSAPVSVEHESSQHSNQGRCLLVRVDGIAPSDLEVAHLVEQLQIKQYFQDVALPYIREGHGQNGSAMREFELTLKINLNPAAEEHP